MLLERVDLDAVSAIERLAVDLQHMAKNVALPLARKIEIGVVRHVQGS